MSAVAILQVTEALRDRLEVARAASGVPGRVFVGPLDDVDASGAALILFLYRVVPSPTLRNSEHRVPTGGTPPVAVYRNALPLDLYYLVTVGSRPNASEETPLRALGYDMQDLQNAPELTGAAVGHQIVRLSLESLSTDEASRIWALFPTANYRTSVVYLATPVWIDPVAPAAEAAPVVQDQLTGGPRAAEVTA
jgi:hypothetical protein